MGRTSSFCYLPFSERRAVLVSNFPSVCWVRAALICDTHTRHPRSIAFMNRAKTTARRPGMRSQQITPRRNYYRGSVRDGTGRTCSHPRGPASLYITCVWPLTSIALGQLDVCTHTARPLIIGLSVRALFWTSCPAISIRLPENTNIVSDELHIARSHARQNDSISVSRIHSAIQSSSSLFETFVCLFRKTTHARG